MNNLKLGLLPVILIAASMNTGCRCSHDPEPVLVTPEPLPTASASATSSSPAPAPVPSAQPPVEPVTVLELLPEHAVYVSGAKRAVLDSRAAAQAADREWDLPYPYQLTITGDAVSVDCGFFPTLQGTWRTAYCLEDNDRHPQKLYIWNERGTYTFSLGSTDYTGFSVGTPEEERDR